MEFHSFEIAVNFHKFAYLNLNIIPFKDLEAMVDWAIKVVVEFEVFIDIVLVMLGQVAMTSRYMIKRNILLEVNWASCYLKGLMVISYWKGSLNDLFNVATSHCRAACSLKKKILSLIFKNEGLSSLPWESRFSLLFNGYFYYPYLLLCNVKLKNI